MRSLIILLSILVLPIFLLSFLTAGTLCTQKEPSSHLLWYKGKKLSPNVLLTHRGDTIRFNPSNATITVTNTCGEIQQLNRMVTELQKTPQRMEEMQKKLAATVPQAALPSYGFQVRTSFRQVQSNLTTILCNTIALPSIKLTNETAIQNAVADLEELLRKDPNELILSLPEPPEYDYNYCGECETDKRVFYQKETDGFISVVIAEDRKVIDKVMGISKQSYLLLPEKANAAIQNRLNEVMEVIMQRIQRKVSFLVDEYIDNALYCEAVANLAMVTCRYMQLLGFDADPNISSAFERSNVTLTGMINKAIDDNDYAVARNINLLLRTVRHFQLLGREMPGKVFEKALKFNENESYITSPSRS